MGIAFQIRDDLFDYGSADSIGKPTGIDIKEKKMTLPLIYALNNSSKSEKRFIINTVKNHNTDEKRVAKVIDMVKDKGGIDYTISRMKEYQEKALLMLHSYPDNAARTSLIDLVNFVISRSK